jgi:hypothetical protein
MPILWIIFSLLCPPLSDRTPTIRTETIPSYNQLFARNDGWTGGDGAFAVPLGNDTTLWLFSDTFIGNIRNNRHVECTMINNTIGLQVGKDPITARVDFFWGRDSIGEPAAFFRPPEDEKGWFWIFDGLLTPRGLFVFLMQIVPNRQHQFDQIGSWLGKVANPHDPPDRWRITQRKIPWGRFDSPDKALFGSAICQAGEFAYIFGADEEISFGGIRNKHMIVARVAKDSLEEFSRWRFFDGTRWQPDWTKTARLCPHMANEYSVSFQSALGSYIAVTTENGLSENIVVRTAPLPEGPWSEPVRAYQCPEARWHRKVACYAAKAHPSLSEKPDELILTYVAGSFDFWFLASDARLYRPRFLRLRFKEK